MRDLAHVFLLLAALAVFGVVGVPLAIADAVRGPA